MKRIMPVTAISLLLGMFPVVGRSAELPGGVVVGLESSNGTLLLGELSCTACHAIGDSAKRLFVKEALDWATWAPAWRPVTCVRSSPPRRRSS